jgi:NAD(P)-dependent dehydrogenase (short-subunit alcohol dehydrogenase family)
MTSSILELPAVLPAGLLAGKVVLVTGASRGLGRAIAQACAAHQATVLLLGRDVKRLESLADEIAAAGAPGPLMVPFNLEGANVDDYAAIAGLVAERCGRLDGMVLNAAMLGEMSGLENYDPVLWARVFQVNVHSQFLLLRAFLPLLRAAQSASIIFTSSSVGRRGRAYWGAYAASKFAFEGMMQTLADELREVSKIRVNSVNPGRMRTRMRAQAYPAENPASLPDPATLAPYFVHLLSDSGAAHGVAFDLLARA